MKYLPYLSLLPCLALAEGSYSTPYSALEPTALATVEHLIPHDYKAIALAEGDLNADKRPDYAVVMEPKAIVDLRSRVLLVALSGGDQKPTSGGEYPDFIPSRFSPHERLAHVGIQDGQLETRFEQPPASMTAKRIDLTYGFRHKKSGLVLSSYQRYEVKRSTGMFNETRIDLLKSQQETTNGSMSSPRHKKSTSAFKAAQAWTLDKIGNVFEFEP